MGRRSRACARWMAGFIALALAVPALCEAASSPISGKLSSRGYTVIALAAGGEANAVVVAKNGTFRLRPPANRVTLHLRARNGRYAGPIVIGRNGNRAILGVRAGARLGAITVYARRGYARVTGKLAKRWIDPARWAKARDGVPIGAGDFGRVRSTPPRVSPPGDLDADGVANPLDVDDDGDLVLDDVERHVSARARTAQATQNSLTVFTLLYEMGNATFPPAGPMTQPLNANAAGITDDLIDAALRSEGKLAVGDSGHQYVSGELDCGGLTYCSAGGTGSHEPPGGNSVVAPPGTAPFPACCDANRNGLGAFDIESGALTLFLQPHASSGEIRTGDVLLAHATCTDPCAPDGSRRIELAGSLASVFATVPAIASYTDELGATHTLGYPLTPSNPGFPLAGSTGTEISVLDGPDPGSDVSVRLTLWRPQRGAIPDEVAAGQGKWIDMGGLLYFAHTNGGAGTTWCPRDTYSDVDPSLAPSEQSFPANPAPVNAAVFIDQAKDRPASASNTFSFTLNLTRCLAAHGESFGPGGRVAMIFDAFLPPVPNQPVNFVEAGYAFYHQPDT